MATAASLLRQTLEEERETDEKLSELAKEINFAAKQSVSEEEAAGKHRPKRAA
jgi:ferritin-like metal-binding protein YciE